MVKERKTHAVAEIDGAPFFPGHKTIYLVCNRRPPTMEMKTTRDPAKIDCLLCLRIVRRLKHGYNGPKIRRR